MKQTKPTSNSTICAQCNKPQSSTEFMPSSSPFWPQGRINICYTCVESMVDGNDLNQVDRLMQHANMAFLPEEWRKMWTREKNAAFRRYANSYYDINYYKYDWSEQNERLMELAKVGVIETELSELRPALVERLKLTWGEAEPVDLLRMEKYYNASLNDYNVSRETERDMLRKIVRLSILIDEDLMRGETDKDKVGMYDKLMKSALSTLEVSKTEGITSIGQICEFIERNGFQPTFYEGVPRDEIDMMMENMQEYTRDLILGEVNIAEMYARKAGLEARGDDSDVEDRDEE